MIPADASGDSAETRSNDGLISGLGIRLCRDRACRAEARPQSILSSFVECFGTIALNGTLRLSPRVQSPSGPRTLAGTSARLATGQYPRRGATRARCCKRRRGFIFLTYNSSYACQGSGDGAAAGSSQRPEREDCRTTGPGPVEQGISPGGPTQAFSEFHGPGDDCGPGRTAQRVRDRRGGFWQRPVVRPAQRSHRQSAGAAAESAVGPLLQRRRPGR